jgi:diacylglycerol kinase (ATP)
LDKKIAVVCNPLAGSGRAVTVSQQVQNILVQLKISFVFFNKEWPEHFSGFTDVWIVGGDGTLNFFINKYPQLHLPLAVFKGGSGNDFHWLLYGGITVKEQVVLVLKAKPAKVDAGLCNGRLFVNGVGIGFDGAVVNDLANKNKKAGKTSYYLSVLKNLLSYREQDYTICSDGFDGHRRLLLMSITNGKRFGGGFHVAPQASPCDGRLDVVMINALPFWKRLIYLPVMEEGNHLSLPFVNHFKTTDIIIESIVPMLAHLDGEFYKHTKMEITILPGRFLFCFKSDEQHYEP